jgi:hypothetical protein
MGFHLPESFDVVSCPFNTDQSEMVNWERPRRIYLHQPCVVEPCIFARALSTWKSKDVKTIASRAVSYIIEDVSWE